MSLLLHSFCATESRSKCRSILSHSSNGPAQGQEWLHDWHQIYLPYLPAAILPDGAYSMCYILYRILYTYDIEHSMCVSCSVSPTLCNSMDCSLPGSSVHGILQARILEWIAMPSSRGSTPLKDWTQVSCIADSFFTTTASWEVLNIVYSVPYILPVVSHLANITYAFKQIDAHLLPEIVRFWFLIIVFQIKPRHSLNRCSLHELLN